MTRRSAVGLRKKKASKSQRRIAFIKSILFSPRQAAEAGLRWLRLPPKPCVVCGEPIKTQLVNHQTGGLDHVHTLSHEPGYMGCKEVWKYWQDKPYKRTRESWLRDAANGDEDARYIYEVEKDNPYYFLDERDDYTDYRSYIASREWEIKARAVKQGAGWKCELCGRTGDKKNIHVHHRHYKTLYQERRQDLEVLCSTCHSRRHGK